MQQTSLDLHTEIEVLKIGGNNPGHFTLKGGEICDRFTPKLLPQHSSPGFLSDAKHVRSVPPPPKPTTPPGRASSVAVRRQSGAGSGVRRRRRCNVGRGRRPLAWGRGRAEEGQGLAEGVAGEGLLARWQCPPQTQHSGTWRGGVG